MQRSHQLDNFYHGNKRRYFFSEDKTIKIFLDNEFNTNHKELMNESNFLEGNIEGFRAAKLISYGSFEHESWMVRTTIPGKLLLDVIMNNEDYDDEKVISGILEQVCILEKNGLYHNDLRPWNILIGNDGLVYIIDYGSISPKVLDGDDLYGQILSCFVLIKEVAQHRIRRQGSQRPPFISPYDFPEKYQKWLSRVWALPSQQWTFQNILAAYNHSPDTHVDIPVSAMLESHLSTTVNYLSWRFTQLQNDYAVKMGIILDKSQHSTKHNATIEEKTYPVIQDVSVQSSDAEKVLLTNELNEQRHTAQQLRKELDLVYACNSWKVTYPLRMISKAAKLLFRPKVLVSKIKAILKKKSSKSIPKIKKFILNRPLLKKWAMRILNKNPALKYKIKKHINNVSINEALVSSLDKVEEPEICSMHTDQPQSYPPKKAGVHEEQKSVLESWLN
ncbi:MAG: hypothetical protein E6556_17255 [Pantoea sp.]|nr:hypothetical protein [Pantoea sp.]